MPFKKARLLLSALCLATASSATFSNELITEVNVDERMYPNASAHFSKTVDLGNEQLVSSVGFLTDWWQKRPTEIRVYEANNGEKGRLIGYKQFFTYLDKVCGSNFASKCKHPQNPVARLTVPVYSTVSSIVVEADGLLSKPNEFAILKSIQVYH
ncbi:hypothetical protein [Spartinivicinus poritis]|uniref:Uncharacterized protein n=1 Tax=Spartinivicinus poritis TaxID=2994640 RepID=A0ABT5UD47_9GAMM|nr:hypothetical protein [Spartinivicinus sp. A2-2]MDE1464298.1 hypothetical protein [Spartinivicinus sp. A2-2]